MTLATDNHPHLSKERTAPIQPKIVMNKRASDSDNLCSSDYWIGLRDGFSAGGFVIERAVVGVGVPMPAAEEIAAAAPETGQTDPFLAATATVCESNRPGRLLVGLLRVGNIGAGIYVGRNFRPFRHLGWKFRDRFQEG